MLFLAKINITPYNLNAMDDFDGIIIFIVTVVVASLLFFGVTTAIRKSFKVTPEIDSIDSSSLRREQKAKMDDVRQMQKRLMQDQKQRIRDLQR